MCDVDFTRTCKHCGKEYEAEANKNGSPRKRKHYLCGDECTRLFRLKQRSDNARRRRVLMPEKHKLTKIYIRNSLMYDEFYRDGRESVMKRIREKVDAMRADGR